MYAGTHWKSISVQLPLVLLFVCWFLCLLVYFVFVLQRKTQCPCSVGNIPVAKLKKRHLGNELKSELLHGYLSHLVKLLFYHNTAKYNTPAEKNKTKCRQRETRGPHVTQAMFYLLFFLHLLVRTWPNQFIRHHFISENTHPKK